MNFFQRLTMAARVAFPGRKAASIFAWPSWREGQPQWHLIDYKTYVAEGFNLNTLVYSAIMYKVRAMTAAPLRAYEGDPDSPQPLPADNELAQVVNRPNPYQSQTSFHSLNVVYLNVAGNAYVWFDRGNQAEGIPEAMYSLRPDRVFIVPGRSESGSSTIAGYVYVPEGAAIFAQKTSIERREMLNDGRASPILPANLMHIKLPNAGDPLEGLGYGLSPISPGARVIDVDNSVTHFLQLFFRNGVMLPGVFKTNQKLNPQVLARVKAQWKRMYGGYENWAEEVGVLEAGTEYQRVGLSFEEMGFEILDDRDESRILGPFGVPPILIGTRIGLGRSTYANYKTAREAFWDDTMVPETHLFGTDYAYYLAQPDEGWFVRYDFSKVPAFQERRIAVQGQHHDAFIAGAITRNEYRRVLGLTDIQDGNVYVITPQMIEIPVIPASLTDTDAGQIDAEGDTRKVLPWIKKKARAL